MKEFLVMVMLFFSTLSFAQTVNCNTLMNYVKTNGSYFSSLSSFTLQSSWLNEVKAYKVEGNIAVIASIKKEGSYYAKEYVFCGVSQSDWNNFNSSWGNGTYGERFHKYIFDNLCNCN